VIPHRVINVRDHIRSIGGALFLGQLIQIIVGPGSVAADCGW
jgi:hypothetical protein